MPLARVPHAVVCAARSASASVSLEAVAQLRLPLNSTQTVHSCFWAERVLNRSSAPKATMKMRVIMEDRFMFGMG